MVKMKNTRGEMTSQQIVILVVLIASFAILLYFLMQLGLGQETEKEVCHNSVITRGSSIVPMEAVPLDCQRSYVCITADGSCEKMTKPIIEKVKTEKEVYEVLAKELSDCWWMFGEGNVNYVGKDLLENLYCSICSQVAFDDSIVEKIPEFKEGKLDKEKFYGYMTSKNMSGSKITYAKYLFGTSDLNEIKKDTTFGEIDLINFQQYVLMGTVSDVNALGWAIDTGGVIAIGLSFVVTPYIAVPIGIVVGAGTYAATQKYVSSLKEGGSGNDYMLPTLVEVNSEVFKSIGCDSIVTKS